MSKKILLWRGCTYRNQLPKESEVIESLLKKLEIEYEVIEEECCGFPLYISGHLAESKTVAERLSHELSKFNRIVVACPACFRMFKTINPDLLDINLPEILHITQFLVEKVDEGVLNPSMLKPVDMTVMYHDPCELGRHEGIYEEPRRLLRLIPGLKLFEPRFTREEAACCGGGGLLSAFSPMFASLVSARKLTLEDSVPDEVDLVITECPQCIVNMRKAMDIWIDDKEYGITSLVQLLNDSIR